MLWRVILIGEQSEQLCIAHIADGAQQRGNGNLTLAVYLDGDYIPVTGFKFQPGTPGRD